MYLLEASVILLYWEDDSAARFQLSFTQQKGRAGVRELNDDLKIANL